MSASPPYEPVETPNPSEFALLVWVSAMQVFAKMANLVAGTTTLTQLDLGIAPTSEGFGDYVYLKPAGKDAEGRMGLLFQKVRTDEEIATPIKPAYDITEEKDWPAVLEDIDFQWEYYFPHSQNYITPAGEQGIVTAPRARVPRIYLPPLPNAMTTITVREFLSHKPFVGEATESDEPHPTEVHWDFIGADGSIVALHKDVLVPGQQGTFTLLVGDTPSSAASINSDGKLFPATNHQTRRDYVVNVIRETELGQYHRKELTYHAPPDRRRIVEGG